MQPYFQNNQMGRRATIFIIIVLSFWVLLGSRLFLMQVVQYDRYEAKVVDQLTVEAATTAERGRIYDRNMNLLATNKTVYRVFIAPMDIQEYEKENDLPGGTVAADIAGKLVEVLGVDYDDVIEHSKKYSRRDETIMKNVLPDTADVLRAWIAEKGYKNLLCLSAEFQRYYCYGDLACHVIGFTNSDGDGVYGVESTYNDYLKGVSGKYIFAKDAIGKSMPYKYESYVDAENGANLVTTLDMRLQYELENQIRATYEASEAGNRTCGIVMDVHTGGILAMAVYPNFDCNDPYALAEEYLAKLETCEYPEGTADYNLYRNSLMFEMWNNKCISETYEPGSTFKILTASVALEEDAVNIDDEFTCVGAYRGEGFTESIACHKLEGHGTVTFARGLQQSCNPTLMMTAERIGLETFYKYFEALGYTTRTGVDLPGEVFGIYHAMNAMHATELAVYSFGQTFKATPLQQLTAICSVANGGYIVTPHVVDHMVDDNGSVIYTYESENKIQIFSEDTCKTVLSILTEGVATDGGARNAYVKGYNVAAKTGTSQKQDKWVYTYDEEGNVIDADRPFRVGSTVGVAPSDDPQIAVLIIVDEPTAGGTYGSIVAAPYVSKFLSVALPYLGVEPHYTEAELATLDVGITNLVGLDTESATLYIANRKLSFQVLGKGSKVIAQVPAGGSRLMTDTGKVYLYTGDAAPENYLVTVPDLMGMSPKLCNLTITNSRLNIKIEGANNTENTGAVVIGQSIEPGTSVPRGTIITVEFRHMDGTD